LAERLHGMQEVRGSNPLSSTPGQRPDPASTAPDSTASRSRFAAIRIARAHAVVQEGGDGTVIAEGAIFPLDVAIGPRRRLGRQPARRPWQPAADPISSSSCTLWHGRHDRVLSTVRAVGSDYGFWVDTRVSTVYTTDDDYSSCRRSKPSKGCTTLVDNRSAAASTRGGKAYDQRYGPVTTRKGGAARDFCGGASTDNA
jgi:hypothetical protein